MEILVCVYLIEGQCCGDLSNNELNDESIFCTEIQMCKQANALIVALEI